MNRIRPPFPRRVHRPSAALVATAILGLAGLGCAAAPTAETGRRPERALAELLLDPSSLAEPGVAGEVGSLHRRLRSEGVTHRFEGEVRALAERIVGDPGVLLLEAQAAAVLGEADRVLDILSRTFGRDGGPPAAEALRGWALERRESWAAAVLAYRSAAATVPAAAVRAGALEGRALEAQAAALAAALDRGRIVEARRALDDLRRLAPDAPEAAAGALRLARSTDDSTAELEALRALAPGEGPERRRWALLEIEEGDAGLGVRLIERAAAEAPDDPAVAADLERAKFLFRLANAPEELRGLIRRPEVDRAGLASLLYWLVPEVRATRAASARIATDVLEHPDREEIVRVVNLGLLDLDPALRTFSPDRPATRGDLFRALGSLRRLGRDEARQREAPCVGALRLGWIADAGECRPDGRISGAEAVEWIRRGTSRTASVEGPE